MSVIKNDRRDFFTGKIIACIYTIAHCVIGARKQAFKHRKIHKLVLDTTQLEMEILNSLYIAER